MKDPGTGGAWGSGHVGPDCEQQVAAPGETQRINLRSRGRETSRKEATPKKNGEPSNTEGWLLTYPLPALKVEPPFLHSSSKRKGTPPPIQAQPFSCAFWKLNCLTCFTSKLLLSISLQMYLSFSSNGQWIFRSICANPVKVSELEVLVQMYFEVDAFV